MKSAVAELGNHLYKHAPFLYRHMYSTYKMISDRAERKLISQVVKEGMTVLDIGANIGVYSLFFARLVGPKGRVLAIEAELLNFERLRAAVRRFPSVEAHCAAASDSSGTCTLYKSGTLNVDHHTYDAGDSRESVTIPAIRIDDLIPSGIKVDFIKMDIQGAEPIAFKGAQRVIEENPGIVLLFEYWPYAIRNSGHDPDTFLASLEKFGFQLRTLGLRQGDKHGEGKDDYYNIAASRSPVMNGY